MNAEIVENIRWGGGPKSFPRTSRTKLKKMKIKKLKPIKGLRLITNFFEPNGGDSRGTCTTTQKPDV